MNAIRTVGKGWWPNQNFSTLLSNIERLNRVRRHKCNKWHGHTHKKKATMNLAIMRKVAEICIHSLFVYRFIDSTVQCLLFSLSHTSSSSVQVITKDFVLFRIFFALSSLALRFEPCVCVMISLLLGVHR